MNRGSALRIASLLGISLLMCVEIGCASSHTRNGLEVGSFEWLLLQANHEVPWAQAAVARKYYKGRRDSIADEAKNLANNQQVPPDYEKARLWYEKAAKNGECTAKHMLVSMYRDGRGGEVNYRRALFWSEQARGCKEPEHY